jgi:hypothetical protein
MAVKTKQLAFFGHALGAGREVPRFGRDERFDQRHRAVDILFQVGNGMDGPARGKRWSKVRFGEEKRREGVVAV